MDLLELGNEARVPLLRSRLLSSAVIDGIQRFLELQLAPTASIHGVLVDVLGVGVLLLGRAASASPRRRSS